jgi:hypothetical protein
VVRSARARKAKIDFFDFFQSKSIRTNASPRLSQSTGQEARLKFSQNPWKGDLPLRGNLLQQLYLVKKVKSSVADRLKIPRLGKADGGEAADTAGKFLFPSQNLACEIDSGTLCVARGSLKTESIRGVQTTNRFVKTLALPEGKTGRDMTNATHKEPINQ